jgi:hypothetical protein
MRAPRSGLQWLAIAVVAAATLIPLSASGSPMWFPLGGGFRRGIVFCMLCLFIVLIEGAAIKLALFGLDGPSWPRAFVLAAILNVASAIAGGLTGVHFDFWAFEFEPNLAAVLGISLGVEGIALVVLFARRRLRRALVTALVMNLASYTVLVLARFPGGARPPWGGY